LAGRSRKERSQGIDPKTKLATDEPQSPDGFSPAAEDTTGASELELDAGEEFIGLVLQIDEDEGEYGTYWRLRLKPEDGGEPLGYLAKDQVKTAIKQGNLEEGSRVWIARGVTEREINGNSYLPTKCEVAD
jgi:hypothetical protein